MCKRKYYHDALTNCDGQRRNECVHSAKQSRVGAMLVIVDLQIKEIIEHKEILS